jgi:tetratricopeptide (TPR) repeat protein
MDLKIPKLPKIAIGRRKVLIAAGAVVALIAVAFIGWTLFVDYTEEEQVATFSSHVAAAEADLALVSEKIAVHLCSLPENPSIAECDAYMRDLAPLAEYGRGVTAYHRQVVGADLVLGPYAGAQSAYIRALDSLNRAFSLWASAAAAYDAQAYTAAKNALAGADEAWKEYAAAIDDYEQELQTAERGEEAPPA